MKFWHRKSEKSSVTQTKGQKRRRWQHAVREALGFAVEPLEPRVLLTTLVGGEVFTYTDARGNPVAVSLTGNGAVELIASVMADDGPLLFGDIVGMVNQSTVNRDGSVLGDGTIPASRDHNVPAWTDITEPAAVLRPGMTAYPFLSHTNPTGLLITLQALAVRPTTGVTYAINIFPDKKPLANAKPAMTAQNIQLITLQNTPPGAGAGTVIARLDDLVAPVTVTVTSPTGVVTTEDHTAATAIPAAAFDPTGQFLYFVGVGTQAGAAAGQVDTFNVLYQYDMLTGTVAVIPGTFGDINANKTSKVTAITFDSSGVLWVYELDANNGNAGTLMTVSLVNTDIVTYRQPVKMINAPVNNIVGLSFIDDDPTLPFANRFVFANTNAGAASQLLRVRLTPVVQAGQCTPWGDTTDLMDPNLLVQNPKPPFRGQDLHNISWNPLLLNPFTGTLGVLEATDSSTDELVLIDTRLRISRGDVFSAYATMTDAHTRLAFAGPSLGAGNFGPFMPNANIAPPPASIGQVYIGALDPTNNAYIPILSGTLTQGIGLRPGSMTERTEDFMGLDNLSAGIVVGRSLQQTINPLLTWNQQMMGSYLTQIGAAAASFDGTIAVLDIDAVDTAGASKFNALGQRLVGDEVALLDPATGRPRRVIQLIDTLGNPLAGVEAMAYGGVDQSGQESLYAICNSATGPVLGTILTSTGMFIPIGTDLGLGANAKVHAMAFGPGSSQTFPGQPPLYVIADPDGTDANPMLNLYEVNANAAAPTAGMAGVALGAILETIIDPSTGMPVSVPVNVGGAYFDNAGRLIVLDLGRGRLAQVDLTGTLTGNVGEIGGKGMLVTADGTINPTVGGIAANPSTGKVYVADNILSSLSESSAPNPLSSNAAPTALLMTLKDPSVAGTDAQNIGNILVDGTVTGRVNISGSIDLFYSGWLLTGRADGGASSSAATDINGNLYNAGNFTVGGDIRNLITLASVGSNGATVPQITTTGFYSTGFDLEVGGKVGQIKTLGSFVGKVDAANQKNNLILPDSATDPAYTQQDYVDYGDTTTSLLILDPHKQKNELWRLSNGNTFLGGYLSFGWLLATNPFANETFDTTQYLGSIRPGTPGQADVIHVLGHLDIQKFGVTQNGALALYGVGNKVDYYGVPLLAGQTITLQLRDVLADQSATRSSIDIGIYDPDGHLIATDYDFLRAGLLNMQVNPSVIPGVPYIVANNPLQGQQIRFTADRPGVYRVAVGLNGDYTFNGSQSAPTMLGVDYDLKVWNAGDMGIGGLNTGGDIILNEYANPTLRSDTGDIGAVVAGTGSTSSAFTCSIGSEDLRAPGQADIAVDNGNFRVMQAGGSMGALVNNGTIGVMLPDIAWWLAPKLQVNNGKVGLLQTFTPTGLMVIDCATPVGSIQLIDSAGGLTGYYATKGGIGVIRAGEIVLGSRSVEAAHNQRDTIFTVGVGGPLGAGTIDLIDVTGHTPLGTTGDFGNNGDGGPIIRTGQGGNVRFIRVSGTVYQDTYFVDGAGAGTVTHDPGQTVTITDDSGVLLTLTPGQIPNPLFGTLIPGTLQRQPATVGGQLTTLGYGIRGSAGVVLIDVTTTSGLTVTASGGGANATAEVSQITDAIDLTMAYSPVVYDPVTGQVINPASNLRPNQFAPPGLPQNNIVINGTHRVDVLNITGPLLTTPPYMENITSPPEFMGKPLLVPNGTWISTVAFNNIINNTTGDIASIFAGDVGTIYSHGTLGLPMSISGVAIRPIDIVTTNIFPFLDQRTGIVARNIGNLIADGGLGNVIAVQSKGTSTVNVASGNIGLIVANSDNTPVANAFDGINAPIYTGGFINEVRIGQGILPSGTGEMSKAGLYARGTINLVSGANADIRGNIVSNSGIGTITLNNGSIINSNIMVCSSFTDSYDWSGVLLTGSGTFETPVFDIGTINLTGNGGIIGSEIWGTSVGNINVAGFGIAYSLIKTMPSTGRLGNLTIGGYGLRNVVMSGGDGVGNIVLTGTGASVPFTAYSTSVRQSENFAGTFDSLEGFLPNVLTDLNTVINANPTKTTTGSIDTVIGKASRDIGYISAYQINAAMFNFANRAGGVQTTAGINQLMMLTGTMPYLRTGTDKVAGHLTGSDIETAGKFGQILIKGNVDAGTTLMAKGAAGYIDSVNVTGDFAGHLTAAGRIANMTVGSPTVPGSGNFSGTLTILGGNQTPAGALDYFKLYGALTNGALEITGNVGQIETARSLGSTTSDSLTIHGNLNSLRVGTDPKIHGSNLGLTLSVQGNLASLDVTGQMTGNLLVQGDLNRLNVTADTSTAGSELLGGEIQVRGAINSVMVTGGRTPGSTVSAQITAGKGLNSVVLTNADLKGILTSALSDVNSVVIRNGNLQGGVTAPNGRINSISVSGIAGTGNMALGGGINAKSLGTLNIGGDMSDGVITVANDLTSLLVGGAMGATVTVTAGWASSLRTGGDMLGRLTIGTKDAAANLTVGRDFGGAASFSGAVNVTVGRGMVAGSTLTVGQNLTSLSVRQALAGQVRVGRNITSITAGSMDQAAIISGGNIGTINITGAVTNSLVQAGLSAGNDGIFGSGDTGEQSRMADLNSMMVGSMSDSLVAAGGNINSFISTRTLTRSSVSSGLVLGGAQTAAVLADPAPLASSAQQNSARQGATLFHGNFNVARIGTAAAGLVSSALTAGVSPDSNGRFDTGNNSVRASLTGGRSNFQSMSGGKDVNSYVLADSGTIGTGVHYTVNGGGSESLTNLNLLPDPAALPAGWTVVTATPTTPQTITVGGTTLTVTVTGPVGAKVVIYDDAATGDRIDALVISGTNAGSTVKVTTSAPDILGLGRVLMADDAQLASFTFNGDLLGDGTADTDLWLDSDLQTFSVRSTANDSGWTGCLGGNVTTMTVNTLGSGQLNIGGRVSTMNLTGSSGDPFVNQLGSFAGTTPMLVTDSSGNSFVYADGLLTPITSLTGVGGVAGLGAPLTLHAPGAITAATTITSLAAMGFDSSDNLYGIAHLNNQSPSLQVGAIASTATLRGLAVDSLGNLFAIDTSINSAGVAFDQLIKINAATGTKTVVGTFRSSSGSTFGKNVLALAFMPGNDTEIWALVNDRDGNGTGSTPADGVALVKIEAAVTANRGYLRVGKVTGTFAQQGVFVPGTDATSSFTAMTVDTDGTIYAIQRSLAGADTLVQLTVDAVTGALTRTDVGTVKLSAADTQIVGLGFDENHSLIALNKTSASASQMFRIDLVDPTLSTAITAADVVGGDFAAFAVGQFTAGTPARTYGYSSSGTASTLYTNPGVVDTLGSIDTADGTFTQLRALASDALGTPLASLTRAMAIDASDNILVLTSDAKLFQYDITDGSLANAGSLGTVTDTATGNVLDIKAMAFNAAGELVGLNAGLNRLVVIDPASAAATPFTQSGLVNAADLTTLSFDSDPAFGFLSYSTATGRFVKLSGLNVLNGVDAYSIGTLTIAGVDFNGHIATSALADGNAIDSVRLTGTGRFTGSIVADGSIGSVTKTTAGDFAGALLAGIDLASVTLTGSNVVAGAVISAGNYLGSFNQTKLAGGTSFAGGLLARRSGSLTFGDAVSSGAIIDVTADAANVTINGAMGGKLSIGSASTLRIGGILGSTGDVTVDSNVSSVTLNSGTDVGSSLVVDGSVLGALNVSQTHSGTIAVRQNVGSAQFANLTSGLVALGQNTQSFTVTGNTTQSLVSFGTWIGADHLYNTADDIIYGGAVNNVTFRGVFNDSVLADGVLTRQGVVTLPGTPNLPADNQAYTGNALAPAIEDVASYESGGILLSQIANLTFSTPIRPSLNGLSRQSVAVAADGFGRVTGTGITPLVLLNAPGAPHLVSATRVDPATICVVFSTPLNTADLMAAVNPFTVTNLGVPFTNLSFAYTTQIGPDGGTQGVVNIISPDQFGNTAPLSLGLTIAGDTLGGPAICGRSGSRSSLRDFSQTGTMTATNHNMFGYIFDGDADGKEGGTYISPTLI